MNTTSFSKHIPAGDIFDSSRLPPHEASLSLEVWRNFIKEQLAVLRDQPQVSFQTDSERQLVCVIDKHLPNLEFVLLNSCSMLADKWGMQIVTRPVLVPWVKQYTEKLHGVDIRPILDPGVTVTEFRRSVDFWKKIAGEYLLMIDTDSIICHRRFDEFIGYDYVAPLWREGDVSPWCHFGGGISLRRKSAMIKICMGCNVNPKLIPNESVFISIMLRLQLNEFHLPEDFLASQFAVERCFYEKPFALHKAWQYIQHQQLQEIFDTVEFPENLC